MPLIAWSRHLFGYVGQVPVLEEAGCAHLLELERALLRDACDVCRGVPLIVLLDP